MARAERGSFSRGTPGDTTSSAIPRTSSSPGIPRRKAIPAGIGSRSDASTSARARSSRSVTRRSLSGQQARRQEPGPPGPRHDHLFPREGFHGHRIFSVLIASSARMIEMIQNRTMIFGSAHPCSSKWWWIGAIRKIRFFRVL